jgi:predicted DNA-binding transcriptional regulator YafY
MKQEKSPATKLLLERIFRIDGEISSGEYPNTNDLAQMLETSTSTISRDIEFMRDRLMAPIEYDKSKNGYYYTEKVYRLPGGFSSAEELLALSMEKSILTLYRETPIFDAANHLLECITAPINRDKNKEWLENRIVVPKIASAKVKPEIWNIVVDSLKMNRVITFQYLGFFDNDYQNRRVHPYQLLFDSGVWYLYAFSEERKAVRIFSLSRMQNAALAKESFTLPKSFSYTDIAGESYFGVFVGEKRYNFSVDWYNEGVIFATERQWADDQKITEIKDGVRIEFTSTQFDKVLRWVLSNGTNAVPVKPPQLVEEWKRQIKDIYKLVFKK